MRALLIIAVIGALGFSLSSPQRARAEGLEPESSLIATSAKEAFPLDARFPKEWWFALDQKMDVAVTSLSASTKEIAAGGQSLMKAQTRTCSIYDDAICYSTGHFYTPDLPQIILSGFLKIDGTNAVLFAFDSGFRAEKISVSPGLLLGYSHRHYLTARRDQHVIIEVASWLGQSVTHTPCYDAFNRAYYCGNLSAWHDFTYDQHPGALFAKLWYEAAF